MKRMFLAAGLMVAPTAFIAIGNGTGMLGGLFVVALVVALSAGTITTPCLDTFTQIHQGYTKKESLLVGFVRSVRTVAYIGTFVFLGSSLLVISGYAFNEIFYSQFPNLGFSFLLLALIGGVYLVSENIALMVQRIAVIMALVGVVIIAVAGFFMPAAPSISRTISTDIFLHTVFLAVMAMLGYDMAAAYLSGSRADGEAESAMQKGLFDVAIVFIVLTLAYRYVIDASKLAETSIPHLILARKTMGGVGRYIMGMVILSGTFAALSALLITLSRQSVVLYTNLTGTTIKKGQILFKGVALCACAGIGAVLGLGLGGEPLLQDLTAASIALWLAGFVLVLLVSILYGRAHSGLFTKGKRIFAIVVYVAAGVSARLIAEDQQDFAIYCGLFFLLAMALFIALFMVRSARTVTRKIKKQEQAS